MNPLQPTWIVQSTVSIRVALLVRSAEVNLLFNRFVYLLMNVFFSFFTAAQLEGGGKKEGGE